MKKLIVMMMFVLLLLAAVTSCKSDREKVKETAETYLSKNLKNPESLKIISCEVRKDTIPFYLSEEMFDLADDAREAVDKFYNYRNMGYLFTSETYEWEQKSEEAKEALKTAYKSAQQKDSIEVEYIAYVKSSGTNSMGGTVSNSTIIIVDKNDPTKILGFYIIDNDFIQKFVTIKILCENYEFKTNKFGKIETDGMSYFEQFVMNDAE